MKTELTRQPHFDFQQGDPFAGEGNVEYPIKVVYYSNCICVEQNGSEIILSYEHVKNLFKEINRHIPEAKSILKIK